MNEKLPCGAQDKLEAAIVQQRRLDMTWQKNETEAVTHAHVLPIDIATQAGVEWLTVLVVDASGVIERLRLDTARLLSFQADDEQKPIISFQRNDTD